jgi:hypothetical protein
LVDLAWDLYDECLAFQDRSLGRFVERYRLGEDPAILAQVPDSFAVLTPASVQAASKICFNTGRYVQVVLYPEKR